MSLIFSTIDRYTGIGECSKSGPKSYSCITPSLTSLTAEKNYVNVHIKADEHLVQLKAFTVFRDPEIVPMLNTTEGRFCELCITNLYPPNTKPVMNGEKKVSKE